MFAGSAKGLVVRMLDVDEVLQMMNLSDRV
jgi:hypothetical protein